MQTTLALLAATVGFSVWHYRRRPYVLQLCIWFNACAVAYMAFGLAVARRNLGVYYGAELELIGWMCVAAVIGFNVAYLIANARCAPDRGPVAGYLPSYTTLVVVVGAGFAFEAAAILLIGPLDFLFSDRVQRFAAMRSNQALFYLANLMNVCLPIVLARCLRFGQRRDAVLLAVLLAHGIVLALFTISRYDLALVLLVGGYFLERYWRVHPAGIVSVLVAAFVATLFYKPVLYGVLLGDPYAHAVDYNEYYNWIRHTLLLLGAQDVVDMPHGGYGLALKSLFVVSPQEDSLAEWFFKEFFAERAILFPGIGYGFSGVWEGYSANGLVGVATHFAFFGVLFGLLERSPGAVRQVLVVFAIVLTYRLFRSEAYNFVKTYAWYFVYPTLAIVVTDRFLAWASRTRVPPTASMRPDVERAVRGGG